MITLANRHRDSSGARKRTIGISREVPERHLGLFRGISGVNFGPIPHPRSLGSARLNLDRQDRHFSCDPRCPRGSELGSAQEDVDPWENDNHQKLRILFGAVASTVPGGISVSWGLPPPGAGIDSLSLTGPRTASARPLHPSQAVAARQGGGRGRSLVILIGVTSRAGMPYIDLTRPEGYWHYLCSAD